MRADWLDFPDAVRRVVDGVQALEAERVGIRDGRGRVLAADVVATVDVPRWTNSAMDGFAVRSDDVAGASANRPVSLEVIDDIVAGRFPEREIRQGQAARIMTGAPVPDGADSVIRVEHTDGGTGIGGEGARVEIRDAQDAGRNLRRRGEDLTSGEVALVKGTVLTPPAIGVATSLGYAEVELYRRPLVALLTSGDELVEVEDFELVERGERIVSSNSYTLAAQLESWGCEVRYLGIARDEPAAIRSALARAAGCDALITSAGISVGEHDHIRNVLDDLGTDLDFWRVRIKPGSPFAFGHVGELGGMPWFGLPGNPVSSTVTCELFVRPAILKMSGHRKLFARPIRASLLEDFSGGSSLTRFLRVVLDQTANGEWTASLTGAQGSGILSSMSKASGLLVVPAGLEEAAAGSVLDVLPLEGTGRSPKLRYGDPAAA